jgi:hypothetical protein
MIIIYSDYHVCWPVEVMDREHRGSRRGWQTGRLMSGTALATRLRGVAATRRPDFLPAGTCMAVAVADAAPRRCAATHPGKGPKSQVAHRARFSDGGASISMTLARRGHNHSRGARHECRAG